MKRLLLLLAVVLSAFSYRAQAQDNCAQTLRLAQSIYEQGRLHELPTLLQECLAGDRFNDEEKVAAYKLLALTYIYLEEPAKADEMMLAILRTDTEFQINPALDPAEFVALYHTFRTTPIYRIGVKLGGTASRPSVVSADYINDGTNNIATSFGFIGTLSSEIPLSGKMKKFTLNPELAFQLISFDGENTNGDNPLADTSLVSPATETQAWISIPVSLQYHVLGSPTTNAYASAGLSADYLLSASKKIISNREGNSAIDENTLDLKEQRNPFNLGALVSAGFKKKIGKGFLVVEVRYKIGLLNLSDPEDTYENPTLAFDNKYADGIYKMNTLSVSVGYVLNRYKPIKLISR